MLAFPGHVAYLVRDKLCQISVRRYGQSEGGGKGMKSPKSTRRARVKHSKLSLQQSHSHFFFQPGAVTRSVWSALNNFFHHPFHWIPHCPTCLTIAMNQQKCAHCRKRFQSQSSLTRHLRHKLHCRYVWNFIRMRRQESVISRTNRERVENDLATLPNNVLPAIQSTIDMSMWMAPAPPDEPDIIDFVTGAKCDLHIWDNSIMEDYDINTMDLPDPDGVPGEEDTEDVLIDPEAPLRYHKPGIFVDSPYRSAVYAIAQTLYEELKNQQVSQGHNLMYPFSSMEEYEVVDFIREAGLSYDHIEKLMRLQVVSEQ